MKLQEIFEQLGYETRSYSGRGMYGKSCLGVEISRDESLFNVGVAVGEYLAEEDSDSPKGYVDSLGRGQILYFPSIEYNRNNNDSEELDEEFDDYEIPEKY